MRKLIFLDMDGVLNNSTNFQLMKRSQSDDIDRTLLPLIVDVIKKTDAKVVISSSWRHCKELVADILNAFKESGLPDVVIGQTPDQYHLDFARGQEIKAWIDAQNYGPEDILRIAIIDDDADAGVGWPPEVFFNTHAKYGITAEIAERMIAHLNEPSKAW